MLDIDYIMDLLQWDRSSEEQERGIELAKMFFCSRASLQAKVHGITVQRCCP